MCWNVPYLMTWLHYFQLWHFIMRYYDPLCNYDSCHRLRGLTVDHNKTFLWHVLKYPTVPDHSRSSVRDYWAKSPHLDPYSLTAGSHGLTFPHTEAAHSYPNERLTKSNQGLYCERVAMGDSQSSIMHSRKGPSFYMRRGYAIMQERKSVTQTW